MVLARIFDPRGRSPRVLLLVSIGAFALFGVSFLVEVRIVFESPDYGDVTGTLQTVWRGVLGVATIGSLLIAMYDLRSDSEPSGGPATGFEIKGENHDIHFHVHVSGLSGRNEREASDEDVDEGGSVTDSEENSPSEDDEETAVDGD